MKPVLSWQFSVGELKIIFTTVKELGTAVGKEKRQLEPDT
jgi:hypothetical protein